METERESDMAEHVIFAITFDFDRCEFAFNICKRARLSCEVL